MKKFLIAPSILSANFACLGEDVQNVIKSGGDMIHFDVMDNYYVPNLTIGPKVLESLRNYNITVPIDVHLMAKSTDRLILDFIRSGADYITIHPESTEHLDHTINLIKDNDCQVGVAFNPATPLCYLDYIIDKIDLILLMSVNPGFSGQNFIKNSLKKIRKVRKLLERKNINIPLQVDGGIKVKNILDIARSGADIFVIGSAIFNSSNYAQTIMNFRKELIKFHNIK
ncbi:ribulose-phosphate 3-epimerase [Buchnera aphidicola (Thelaxes californica)]|uniref:Ribulose-phosphate 3-epimerase n=1 Tax=Buchnera aphidicola (Thelaxes californica) TaxID=1315998 RepID=A0A4D6YAQ2_9GAMM|nr:ribulose-phosphate 3-epimerase [Buchnera aphidicola]QCI26937.1 ribulose-phosphate 3-epimerase [Buchnera aphidicola (Thelaxes californica)]